MCALQQTRNSLIPHIPTNYSTFSTPVEVVTRTELGNRINMLGKGVKERDHRCIYDDIKVNNGEANNVLEDCLLKIQNTIMIIMCCWFFFLAKKEQQILSIFSMLSRWEAVECWLDYRLPFAWRLLTASFIHGWQEWRGEKKILWLLCMYGRNNLPSWIILQMSFPL